MGLPVRAARTIVTLALAAGVAGTLTADNAADPASAPAIVAELRAISTRLDGARSTVLIEPKPAPATPAKKAQKKA